VAAALEDLDRASAAAAGGLPAEIMASEIREAIRHVDGLTGRDVVPEVLDQIFSRFCVGK
jgi:tRNA modification GTPase